jgi:hypothetical protein
MNPIMHATPPMGTLKRYTHLQLMFTRRPPTYAIYWHSKEVTHQWSKHKTRGQSDLVDSYCHAQLSISRELVSDDRSAVGKHQGGSDSLGLPVRKQLTADSHLSYSVSNHIPAIETRRRRIRQDHAEDSEYKDTQIEEELPLS